jgi:hypothetical protein
MGSVPESEGPDDRRRPASLGIYDAPQGSGFTRIEGMATGASVLWVLALTVFLLLGPEVPEADASIRGLLALIAFIVPVALIWAIATTTRASLQMREESRRLRASVDAMRQSYIAQNQKVATGIRPDPLVPRLDEIAAATRRTEALLAGLADDQSRQPAPPLPEPAHPSETDQPRLALGPSSEDDAPPLDSSDFITALNFPVTADDAQGFAALRRALRNRRSAQLVQAAQDVLTLLSQDGIYMDDLVPDRARPDLWRQFGQGVRGRPVAALGGIHDRAALSLTLGRMKQDPIFRDAAHHFLRIFDRSFADFEKRASDSEIAALAETRTARAFMLLGRVAGTFD